MKNYLSSSSSSFNYLSKSYLFSDLQLEPKDHVKRLRIFAKVFLTISSFFWLRAVYISKFKMKSRFDMGTISFFLAALSSLYLYAKTRNGVDQFRSTGITGRAFVTFTHVVVSFHHMIGLYMAITVGKEIYMQYATFCFCFIILWAVSARIAWVLTTNTIEYGADDDDYYYDDDEEEDEEKFIMDDHDLSPRIDIDDTLSRRTYA